MYGFDRWLEGLEARHLADLTFSEVVRALRALSARYVERRATIGSALETSGKRAAFALFYGPLHFLLVREIVGALGATGMERIVDLGCGTGAGGAAWALASVTPASVLGIDRQPWAVSEAAWTYRTLDLDGRAKRAALSDVRPPRRAAVLASFAINELMPQERTIALRRLTRAATESHPLLVVEPIARAVSPWWDEWARAFAPLGGRTDEWRLTVGLPELLVKLERAAGLDHRVLTARTIWVSGSANRLRQGYGPPSPGLRRGLAGARRA